MLVADETLTEINHWPLGKVIAASKVVRRKVYRCSISRLVFLPVESSACRRREDVEDSHRKEGVKNSNGMAGPAPEEPTAAATQAINTMNSLSLFCHMSQT